MSGGEKDLGVRTSDTQQKCAIVVVVRNWAARQRRRWWLALVVACWLCGSVSFAVFSWCNGLVAPPGIDITDLSASDNESGAFSFWRFGDREGRQTGFRISGRNLRLDNGRHGFLRTPLHKTVIFEGLDVRLYRYSGIDNTERRWNGASGERDFRSQVGPCDAPAAATAAASNVTKRCVAKGSVAYGTIQPIHAFWSRIHSTYFYTIDESEYDKLVHDSSHTWRYEGIASYAYPPGSQPENTVPVHRFWSDTLGRYLYTSRDIERDRLSDVHSDIWTYQRIAWYTNPQAQSDIRDYPIAQHVPTEATETPNRSVPVDDGPAMAIVLEDIRDLEHKLKASAGQMKVKSPLFDMRRATKVLVRGLNYSLFRDDQLELDVQCMRAEVSGSSSGVILRGRVTVTNEGGDILMSNRVIWDVEKNLFDVPGSYILKRDDSLMRGQGLRCDHRLSVLHGRPRPQGEEVSVFRLSRMEPTRSRPIIGRRVE